MSFVIVSSVSQTLADKCSIFELRRTDVLLVSLRTLFRSVEESDGAEAWRLIHNRYAPDT